MTRLQDLEQLLEDALSAQPETGEQWGEICWLEAEIDREKQAEHDDHSQFGMGA